MGKNLANGLSNPPYQRFVLTPASERVTMFLLRCMRPCLRHWAETASLPLKNHHPGVEGGVTGEHRCDAARDVAQGGVLSGGQRGAEDGERDAGDR